MPRSRTASSPARVTKGTTFRAPLADGLPTWEVVASRGRGTWGFLG